ncbi:MAG: HD domain-containing protein [Phycisphaerales bacterium JB043]
MTPDEARALMHEWTPSEALRGHMEAVAACCRSYADLLDGDNADRWEVCGILHDFDYERHPTEEEHPFVGVRHLESIGVDEEIREAILGHANYSGVARETPMARALFAVDELSGFIVACAKVRPNGISDLAPKSVKKKLKDKAFAAAVSREDIATGHAELEPLAGLDMTAHIQRCIDAIRDAGERVVI